MKFYYNADLNICADRDWLIRALWYDGKVETKAEAAEGLDTCKEFYGWYDCGVSDTIQEKF